jgi:uncharacterized protein (DUF427 family)
MTAPVAFRHEPRLPSADHPITITPTLDRVVVTFAGKVIADSIRALTLKEASYPAVQYIPIEDARMEFLAKTDHHSHCPYKGEASYYTLNADGRTAENAVWSYEQPFPAMQEIAGHLAFYPDKVDKIEIKRP